MRGETRKFKPDGSDGTLSYDFEAPTCAESELWALAFNLDRLSRAGHSSAYFGFGRVL